MNKTFTWLSATMLGVMATFASAQSGALSVELNKFEPGEPNGCQAYFLFRNETGKSFEGFEMSLAILDGNGVIDRLLSIDAAPPSRSAHDAQTVCDPRNRMYGHLRNRLARHASVQATERRQRGLFCIPRTGQQDRRRAGEVTC